LGDIDSTSYRYLDEWLRVALVAALKLLQRWWGVRYVIDDTTYVVSRYAGSTFSFDEPPVIQQQDEQVIVLMAAILTKEGSLENASWTTGSWRDAEIAVSNIEGSRVREAALSKLWDELQFYILPPMKRLMGVVRTEIPGAEEYHD
jgi:hypothetical protein